MEHEWEELFVVRYGENVYAGIDRCNNCEALRWAILSGFTYRTTYMRALATEPRCVEGV